MNNRQLGWVYYGFVVLFAIFIAGMDFCPLAIKLFVIGGTLIVTFFQFRWDKELYQ